MTIILMDSSDELQRYEFTLGEDLTATTSTNELYELVAADPKEQLIIVGPKVKMETAKTVAEHFRVARPNIGVILLRTRLDISTMSEAIKSGIREVVSADDAAALVAAAKRSRAISIQIEDSSSASNVGTSRGKVLMVFSAKGGCGKTTMSVNLAEALALHTNSKVALLDFDLQFGDVSVALQLEPKKTISDAISMQNSLDELGIQSLMVKKDSNLDILLAPTNPTDIEFISTDLVRSLISSLRLNYDYIVIDTAPAFTDVILEVFDQADRCFLLTSLDMPAIKNLKVVISTLEALNIRKSKLAFVLNKSDLKTGVSFHDLEEMVGEKFIASIPASDEVSASTNRGRSLVAENPKNPVSREIIKLAIDTNQIFNPTSENKQSIFGRLK